MKKFAGYNGYYKGYWFRSTLEYVYAKYLEYKGIAWDYESHTYTLTGGERYTPDFFLEGGKIIEIKGAFNLATDKPRIDKCIAEFGIDLEILQEKDIRALIKPTPLIYNHLVTEWKGIAKLRGSDFRGEKNPMFGHKQTSATRKKISVRAKERFNDPEWKAKFICNPKRIAYHESRKGIPTGPVVEREELKCGYCNNTFLVTPHHAKSRKFCSKQCAIRDKKSVSFETRNNIKIKTLEFTLLNQNLLFNLKMNKIGVFIKALLEHLELSVDHRTLHLLVIGEQGTAKRLILYLKDYIENVRRAILKQEGIELEDKKPLG